MCLTSRMGAVSNGDLGSMASSNMQKALDSAHKREIEKPLDFLQPSIQPHNKDLVKVAEMAGIPLPRPKTSK